MNEIWTYDIHYVVNVVIYQRQLFCSLAFTNHLPWPHWIVKCIVIDCTVQNLAGSWSSEY